MIAAFAVIVACAACSRRIDPAEADRIAQARLEGYAREMGYAIDRYSVPEVQDQDPFWMYSYRYDASPKHELVVTIDRWGNAELSWAAR
jgi:hypothetical protein